MEPGPLDARRLRRLAAEHGTPLWVLDAAVVRRRVAELAGWPRVRYAQKANDLLALLALLRELGVHLDAVSAGELERARRAGFGPAEVRYNADLFERGALALLRERGLGMTLGSADMLEAAAREGLAGEVWLRVNPGFGHGHHAKVDTGGPHSKHGIWHQDLPAVAARARALGIAVRGLHVHVGSGSELPALVRAAPVLVELASLFADTLRGISAGGGLPVPASPEEPRFDHAAHLKAWAAARDAVAARLGRAIELEVEPGRYLVAEAGVLVCEVRGRKRTPGHDWVLVDAGFNDLVRPSFYGARHPIEALGVDGPRAPRLVAGPLCESGDVFTRDRAGLLEAVPLPELAPGDLLALRDAGAYGQTMSSNYNARPLAPVVLVDGDAERLARRRQPVAALFADEQL